MPLDPNTSRDHLTSTELLEELERVSPVLYRRFMLRHAVPELLITHPAIGKELLAHLADQIDGEGATDAG